MRIEDLTNEQIERAKACTTREERLAFLKENSIEIPDDLLDEVAGGAAFTFESDNDDCPNAKGLGNLHDWVRTGKTKPSKYFGTLWPDYEEECCNCGAKQWVRF